MSEVSWCFVGLGLITTVQFCMITNRLIGLEEKINALKENDSGEDNN